MYDFKPTCFSLNEFVGKMTRMKQNKEKEKYGEFMNWVLEYYDVPKLQLHECNLHIKFHWHTRTRRDYDNYIAVMMKFYNDAIVKYGLLEDDNTNVIKVLSCEADYIKASMSSVEFVFTYV